MSEPQSNIPRKWLFRSLAIVIGPLIFFGLVELVLLLFGYGYSTNFLIPHEKEKGKLHDNKDFSRSFFPTAMARTSQPILISESIPEKTYRIIMFGGSAAMGDPDPAFGPLRVLKVMLENAYPDSSFEVVNTAVTAINSHVVREIASDLEEIESDLWIVYMGNNEVYGPFGAGTVFGSISPPLWVSQSGLFFKKTKIGQLAHNILGPKSQSKKNWGGLEMFLDNLFLKNDPALERVYNNYSKNLADIIDSGKIAGAKVLVSSVAVNIKNFPPFRSELAQKMFNDGAFVEARDEDTLRFRADSKINSLARKVAFEKEVQFVDSEKAFIEKESSSDDLFVDHVHFAFGGSYLLARTMANKVADSLNLGSRDEDWLDEEGCAKKLGFTPVNKIQILNEMQQRFSEAPFNEHTNHEERDSKLAAEISRLNAALTSKNFDKEQKNYETLLNETPDDWQLRKEFALHLSARGKNVEASEQYKKIADLLPHRPEMWYRLGMSYRRSEEKAKAQIAFERAIKLKPNFYQAHYNLAFCYIDQKQWSNASESFKNTVSVRPSYVMGWIRWGEMLDKIGKSDEVLDKYQSAISEVPNSFSANKAIAAHYLKIKDYQKSEKYFRATLKVGGKDVESNLGLAIALTNQKKFQDAVSVFEFVLRIDPDNATARRYLQQLGAPRQ